MSKPVTLVITMDENNQIGVSGPISNKLLCYGMLAVAHDAIKDFNDNAAKQRSPIDLISGSALSLSERHT
jgi:hypothetical protein